MKKIKNIAPTGIRPRDVMVKKNKTKTLGDLNVIRSQECVCIPIFNTKDKTDNKILLYPFLDIINIRISTEP
jgi:hypothetical protein